MSTLRRTRSSSVLAEDMLLLLYHPETGRPLIHTKEVDLALGGALLAELAERQRIQLTEPHRVTKNRAVVVLDPAPTGHDVLDEALQRVAAHRSARAQVVVSRISKGVRCRLLDDLVQRGVLRLEESRIAGVIPTSAWPAVDSRHTEQRKRDLQRVLDGEGPPTHQEVAVISLLHAVRRTAQVLGEAGHDRRELKRRAKRIAEGDATGEAVRRALDAAAF